MISPFSLIIGYRKTYNKRRKATKVFKMTPKCNPADVNGV
jgi:hypothetical protein